MSEYQLLTPDPDGAVLRKADSMCIPADPANRDWIEYQQWVEDGGVPDPYAPPVQPPAGSVAPKMVAAAHADIRNGAITLAGAPFNIASAAYVSKGVFRFTFINPLADANYGAMITAGAAAELAAGQAADSFTINVYVGGGGAAHDPKALDFQIFKVPG